MSRSVKEWVGKTDDTPAPPRVRLRVFESHGGICALSGRKITPSDQWDVDHRQALINGGENRESNLQPVIRAAHRAKTAEDVAIKAKCDRVRKKHIGIHKPGRPKPKYKRKINGQTILREDK